jgi:hypothetical protein
MAAVIRNHVAVFTLLWKMLHIDKASTPVLLTIIATVIIVIVISIMINPIISFDSIRAL